MLHPHTRTNGPRRRSLLLGGIGLAVAAATACSSSSDDADAPPEPDPRLSQTLAAADALAAAYEATISEQPDLADRLQPLLANHRSHIDTLTRLLGETEDAAGRPTIEVGTGPEALAEAERLGYQQALDACESSPDEYAVLLGEIAACRATHEEVLT